MRLRVDSCGTPKKGRPPGRMAGVFVVVGWRGVILLRNRFLSRDISVRLAVGPIHVHRWPGGCMRRLRGRMLRLRSPVAHSREVSSEVVCNLNHLNFSLRRTEMQPGNSGVTGAMGH